MKNLRIALVTSLLLAVYGHAVAQNTIMLSVRDLASNYQLDTAYLNDTVALMEHLNNMDGADYPTLSTECLTIRTKAQNLLNSLTKDYTQRDSLIWLDTNIAVADFGIYHMRLLNLIDHLSELSARYVNLERERIETEKRLARERAEAERRRQQEERNNKAANLRDAIDMHHNSIISACDGIGISDKVKLKELRDLYYAYLIVYNKYDLSAVQATDETIAQLDELNNFQNDLLEHCLGSDSYTSQIDNFKNVLKARCGKQNSDIYKSYSRVFKQTMVPISFANIDEYQSYINRLKAVIAIQNRYIQTIDLREAIQKGAEAIASTYGKRYKDVVKSYNEAASAVETVPSFTGSTESIQFITNLEEFIDVQQIYVDNFERIDDIRNRHDSILKGHPVKYMDVVSAYREILPSLSTTPSFITKVGARNFADRMSEIEHIQQDYIEVARLRNVIESNDKTITDGKKTDRLLFTGYRDIRKVSNLSPSFSSSERGRVFLKQLNDFIDMQDRCITILDMQDSIQANEKVIDNREHKLRNLSKAYSRMAKAYRNITEIANTEDLRRYERQCRLVLNMQSYFLAAVNSNDAADIDERLRKVSDIGKIQLIIGMD